jgi:site-specific recombinase XerD
MTELRQKMIRALDLKNLSNNTKRAYLTAVAGLAKHYRQSPEKITATMIDDYLLYLKNEKGNAPASCSSVLTGLRFFYTHILDKQISVGFSLNKKPRRLPTVLRSRGRNTFGNTWLSCSGVSVRQLPLGRPRFLIRIALAPPCSYALYHWQIVVK